VIFVSIFIFLEFDCSATTCYVALNPQVKGVSGEYFSGCNPAAASSESRDAELAKKLWDFSMDLVQ
jgi:WW domain-containing oxidoreductase